MNIQNSIVVNNPSADVRSAGSDVRLRMEKVNLYYGDFHAVKDISLDIGDRSITAIIGPSGCGKSSMLRLFNRMNDLIPSARVEGLVEFDGVDVYQAGIDVVELRKRVGMVFQKPNPFPMSIYDNVCFGPKRHGIRNKRALDEIVEKSLIQAALWDEVKDKLDQSGLSISGGQQQRLCIARVLAVEPEVILMDEPCSALDPIATLKIEDLMRTLSANYTIVIVTHNMQQAARVSDMTAFLMVGEDRAGMLVEYGLTSEIFTNPKNRKTEDYITGRFG
ncbi:MAG: phosphate ABC transporter ATP-binding protein [Dehalococcoidales bacterium]|jgi:phosphate transport system ATP-binding protein|nr:phosphate ABC transporter ATP-binding protein [Dehalococcoidales bacterium]